ncbi:MAG: hypothetical protein IKO55_09840 [Kiritimatiellae bacterium]|nr:hypothetical protein [Kiritimatiellia bacterium]
MAFCCTAALPLVHHFALDVGHHAAELKKLGHALGVEAVGNFARVALRE